MRGHRYALRTKSGDFVVEELIDYKPGGHGAFGIYKLKKSGLETTAALRIIASTANWRSFFSWRESAERSIGWLP